MSKENPKCDGLTFNPAPDLIPVVMQDINTMQVLMVAYATREALLKTLETGKATFYSRSRQKIWAKGETSGNAFLVRNILVDCDQDALIYLAEPEKGGACDTEDAEGQKRVGCFYRTFDVDPVSEPKSIEEIELTLDESRSPEVGRLGVLYRVLQKRFKERPRDSRATEAFEIGSNFISLRLTQVVAELTAALTKRRWDENVTQEASEVLYWLLILLINGRVNLDEVLKKLLRG